MLAGIPRDETRKAMAAFGVAVADEPEAPPSMEVWPENWDAMRLFRACSTQWRTGVSGCVGLDYSVVPFVASQIDLQGKALRRAFAGLQVMEVAALEWMAEQRKS